MAAGGVIVTDEGDVVSGIDGDGGILAGIVIGGRFYCLYFPGEEVRIQAGPQCIGRDGLRGRLIIAKTYDFTVGPVQLPVYGFLFLGRIEAGGPHIDLPR